MDSDLHHTASGARRQAPRASPHEASPHFLVMQGPGEFTSKTDPIQKQIIGFLGIPKQSADHTAVCTFAFQLRGRVLNKLDHIST